MQHVINTQQIELLLDEQKTAFRLQEQTSRQFYQRMLPILERVFDKLGPEGEIVSIDQLVIDMGVITAEKLEDGSWADELYSKVLKQTEELIREGSGRRRAVRKPVGAGRVEQWLAYMRTGRLPWNVTMIDGEWLQRVLEHLATDHAAVMAVRRALATGGSLLRRVIEQHEENFLVMLAEVLTARNQAGLPAVLQELVLIRRELAAIGGVVDAGAIGVLWVGLPNANKKILFMAALRLAATETAVWTTEEIVRALLRDLGLRRTEIFTIRKRLAGQLDACDPLLVETANRETAPMREDVVRSDEKPKEQLPSQIKLQAKALPMAPDEELEEGIFVPYAGLVLLHAFLPTFLGRVGLVQDGIFSDDAARIRAVQLLQYVATGLPDNPEYELVIAKLLCALPLEEPVEREFGLTAAEAEEADALLDACLSQWAVLQNTSREGLRVNFLNRNGMLYRKNGQLRLEVERMAYDMLLDQLPWNLSLVRLPWMAEMLHVNWR
jgi:hypothetical protein